ncbi:hypothetical protein GCM10007962_26030 [Yeosuana aromativorans]|uniref:Outer membrane protein beta-barrel domain-containing protein n=1 Tax=Yeosuana aromativorans TaxID=288019 RepID=A0A8J3BQ26_9FLAO|nr:hypothetical protein [Yeosuana aromativorans]GGK30512.1 hypothetical protein GCM10007962_26030 [Yeosuana aromativorans]
MKNKELILLVAICICFVTTGFSQHANYHIRNGIGISAAVTKFDIITNNFTTKQEDGFLGGLLATVDIPNRWYNMSFGMQLSQNNIGVLARPNAISTEDVFVDYKLLTAQIALLGHIKIIEDYLTIDGGPMLQYNGKMELKDNSKESYFINNYNTLLAKDISSISQFNVNGAIGASAGFGFFRLKAQYIYGFTNILSKLNSQSLDTNGSEGSFKGHQSMLALGAMIVF